MTQHDTPAVMHLQRRHVSSPESHATLLTPASVQHTGCSRNRPPSICGASVVPVVPWTRNVGLAGNSSDLEDQESGHLAIWGQSASWRFWCTLVFVRPTGMCSCSNNFRASSGYKGQVRVFPFG